MTCSSYLVYGGQNPQALYARHICAQENCQDKLLQRIPHVRQKDVFITCFFTDCYQSYIVAQAESVSSPLLCIFDPRMRNGCERHDRVSTVTLRRTVRRPGRGRSGSVLRVLRVLRVLGGLGLGVLLGLVCALSQLSPSFVATFKTSLQASATASIRTTRTGCHKIHKIHKTQKIHDKSDILTVSTTVSTTFLNVWDRFGFVL